MAKANIVIDSITPGTTTAVIKFTFSVKAGYKIKTQDGIRLYYDTTGYPHGGNNSSPFVTIPITTNNSTYVAGEGTHVEYTLTNPAIGSTSIWVQLRMQIWTEDESWHSYYASYRDPQDSGEEITFRLAAHENELFMVANYTNPVEYDDEDGHHTVFYKTWVDFTACIEVPSYDVNYQDINEDWDDANYVTHRVRVRQRINGKFNMRFITWQAYNGFIYLLKNSKKYNGRGSAYVELRLQINDDLDENTVSNPTDFEHMKPTFITGHFFLKMDSNPWAIPVFGHFDKYQSISVTIQEA